MSSLATQERAIPKQTRRSHYAAFKAKVALEARQCEKTVAELSAKYEDIYLKAYATGSKTRAGIGIWIKTYNTRHPHQGLAYRMPDEVYWPGPPGSAAAPPCGRPA